MRAQAGSGIKPVGEWAKIGETYIYYADYASMPMIVMLDLFDYALRCPSPVRRPSTPKQGPRPPATGTVVRSSGTFIFRCSGDRTGPVSEAGQLELFCLRRQTVHFHLAGWSQASALGH